MKNAARPFYKSKDSAHDTRPAFALRPIAYFVMLACCDAAIANPNGPQIISGSVQMQGLGTNKLSITNTPGAIINWQGFSIGAGQLTNFIQQSGASAVLNRVVGPDISQIQGTLQSNGRVFLINPAGIVIGAGAVIDTAGFVGSTLNMLDADFLKGKLSFQGDASAGSIINQGYIKTTHGGSVVLVAPNIENSGIIQTDDGRILLAAGKKLTIGSLDANDVQFEVQAPTDSVLNIGQLLANGGAVGVFAGSLKHTGDIRANALTRDEGGRIVLRAQDDVTLAAGSHTSADGKTGGAITVQSTTGTTIVSGEVSAKGSEGKGGDVRVLGDRVGVFDAATIDASGAAGGGQILVGGDYRGGNANVQNAKRAVVGAEATLRADATESGDGGKVIVWSDEVTKFDGTISARGAAADNGGFAETSSMGTLAVGEGSHVDLRSPAGKAGTWLLDPINIIVQNGGTATRAQVDSFNDPGTTLTISPATIAATFADLTLQADNDITFASSVAIPNTHTITAQAGRSIIFDNNVAITGLDASTFTFIANETVAAGVHAANRSPGAATISMGAGSSIAPTTTGVRLQMNSGAGHAGTSGDIVISTVGSSSSQQVSIIHNGLTAGGRILRTDATSLINGTNAVFLAMESSAGASSIGTSSAPIRINTPNIEARNVNGTGGIFIDSQRNTGVTVGNTGLSTGGLSGIQAPAGGPIELTLLGTLSLPLTGVGAPAPCGTTGGGGPVCSGPVAHTGVNDTVTMRALDMTIAAGMRGSTVTLLPSLVTTGTNNQVNLNANPATNTHLHLNQAEVNQISTSLLRIGDASSGDVSFVDPSLTVPAGTLLTLPAGTALEIRTGGNIISGTQTTDIVAPNTNVTLTAGGSIGATGANRFLINPGTGTVNLSASTGGIFVEHTAGTDMDLSKYVVATPSGSTARPLELATTNANITVSTGTTTVLSGPFDVSLTTGGPSHTITLPNTGTYSVNSLALAPTGGTALSGTQTFNTPVTTSGSITSSGTVSFNQPLDMNAGAGLTVSAGTTTIGAASDISGPLAISGTGTLAVNGDTSVNGNFSLIGTGTLTGTALLDLVGANNIWQGSGAMTGTGTTTIVKGTLTISDTSQKTFGPRTLTIAAGSNLVWSGGNMSAGNGGVVNVPAGASFTISNDNQWLTGAGSAGTPTTLNLGGQLARTTTTGVAALDAMIVTGGGAITISNGGTLRLSRDAGNAAGTISGLTTLNSGNTLEFAGGAYTLAGNVTNGTPGDAGNITVSGGSLTTTGNVNSIGALTISGGTATFGATANLNPNSIAVSGASTSATFNGPVTDDGTLTVSAGTATFNGASNITGATTFSGGTIGGTGALNLNGGGTWSGGTMTGTGTTTLAAAGLTLSTGTHVLRGGRTFSVPTGATATWTGGDINMAESAVISTAGTGVWADQNTTAVSIAVPAALTGTGTFTNGGTYTKTGTGTTTIGPGVAFNNSGGVNDNAGTLRIAGGGTGTGTFAVPATLEFSAGTYDFNAGTIINGAGTVLFSGATANVNAGTYNVNTASGTTRVTGGTVTVAAPVTATSLGAIDVGGGTLTLNSGETLAPRTLDLSAGTLGGADTLNVAGGTTWTGGTMTGAGTTNATNGLTIGNGTAKTISGGRTLANGTGTANWTGNETVTFANGTISNAGAWADQTTGASMTGTGTFTNTSGYTKSGAGTTTMGVAFNNTGGTVTVNAGTLLASGTFNNTGTATINAGSTLTASGGGTSSGTLTPNGTGLLDFTGSYGITGGVVNGTGTLRVSGGTTTVSGGNFNIAAGSTTVPTGGTLTLSPAATGTSVGNLTISGGTVNLNSGETLAATALTLSAGTLGGTDRLDVSGLTQWSGGTMTDAGETHANGGLTITGGTKNLSGGHSLNIPGGATTTWSATGGIVLAGGAAINTDGTWTDQTTDASITGTGTFANGGAYQKTAAGTTTIAVPFTNVGSVSVTNGTLRLNGGSGATPDTGTFNTAANTTIEFGGGTHVLETGSALGSTGSGRYLLSNGALTANTAIGVANFDITGGTLNGSGTVTLGSTGNWTGGTIDGATGGQFIVGAGAGLAISGAVTKSLDNNGRLTNNGTTTWSGNSDIVVSNGSSITNGNLFIVQNDRTIQANAGTGSFVNTGTFRKTAGAGDTTFGSGIPVTNNGGTFDAQSGRIVFGVAGNQFNGGSFIGAGRNRIQAASAFTGTIHATNLDLALGTLTGTSIFDAGSSVDWSGGTFDQAGTTTFAAGSALTISGASSKGIDNAHVLSLSGTTDWTGTGNLVLARNAVISNQAGGVFSSQNDQSMTVIAGTATFNNAGTFRKTGGSLTLVEPVFNNSNAVSVTSGTLRLGSGTHSGTFAAAADNTAIEFGTSGGTAHVFGAGTQLNSTGTGKYVMTAGTVTANTDLSVANLDLTGATLNGSGTVTLGGTGNWTGGTIDGTTGGQFIVAGPAALAISGGVTKTLDHNGRLVNQGTATWSGASNIVVSNGSSITNANQFIVQNDQTMQANAGAGSFVNTGTFTKTGNAGDTTFGFGMPVINNGGTFDAQTGGIVFGAAGNTFTGGSFLSTGAGTGLNVVQGSTTLAGTLHATRLRLQASVTGTSTFDSGSVVDWTNGVLDQAGTTTFAAGSTLNISGGTSKSIDNGHALSLAGTTNWSGTGNIVVSNGSSITNANLFVAQNDQTIQANAGAGSFVNTGTFRKTGNAGDTTFGLGMPVTNNGGTFDAQTGRIVFTTAGNAFTGGSFVSTGAATGTNRIQSNSTLDGTIHATNLDLASGTITGTRTFDAGSVVTWSGSTLDQAGTTTFVATSTLNISGASGKLLDHAHVLALGGATNWSGTGDLTVNNGAQITNQSTGVFNAQNDQTLAVTTGAGTFTNQGTFNKTAGPGSTQINTAFTNPGTINVSAGTLQVNSAFPTNPGTINVLNGATFSTTGALANDGTIGGEGTVNPGGTTLTNNNVLRPGAVSGDTTGTLSITGNLTQGAGGRVDLELGGTAAGNFDIVAVSGAASLTGTVTVNAVGGYVPTNGDTFQVITAGSRTGNFTAVNKGFAAGMRAAYGTGLQFIIDPTTVDTFISTNTDWTVPGNWNLGHVPGTGETAVIPDLPGTPTITIASGTQTPDRLTSSESLQISGGTLSLAQASTITGNLTLDSGALQGAGGVAVSGNTVMSGGTLQPASFTTASLNTTGGTINVPSGGLLAIFGGGANTIGAPTTLANAGTFRVSGGSSVTVAGGATFTNVGTSSAIDVQNGSATINGFANNPGNITVGANSSFTTSGALTNTGGITLGTGSTFSTGGDLTNTGGTIGGLGTINLNSGTGTLFNAGTVAPGASPGIFAITGNYSQSPAGVLAIELGGTTPGVGGYDVLQISGNASLAGTLNVANFGGFVPAFGNRFDVMTFASLTGDFNTINFPANAQLQAQPGATAYTLVGFGIPLDDTANQLKRLQEELELARSGTEVEEPKFRGGRQICE